ncbi:hypothetical protein BGX29_002982 [Mortierella sp. GBA35]|nr:hypothetical protein BGX29_002982 [Mortierella sp. GBA35]
MDFFAQAYSDEPLSDVADYSKDSSKYSTTQHAGQGYGCESNSHLRRASSGLEADLGQKHFYGFSHYPTHDYNAIGSPAVKNSHQGNERSPISVNTGAAVALSHDAKTVDVDSATTTPISPSIVRRTSVSNPCLLHHTNSNGSGSVRPPTMPRTLSPPRTEHTPSARGHESSVNSRNRPEPAHGRSFSAIHQPTIAKNPEAYF